MSEAQRKKIDDYQNMLSAERDEALKKGKREAYQNLCNQLAGVAACRNLVGI